MMEKFICIAKCDQLIDALKNSFNEPEIGASSLELKFRGQHNYWNVMEINSERTASIVSAVYIDAGSVKRLDYRDKLNAIHYVEGAKTLLSTGRFIVFGDNQDDISAILQAGDIFITLQCSTSSFWLL